MPSARFRPFLANTSFRIALLNATLLAAAMAAAASGAWIATRDLAARDLQQRISLEIAAIREEARGEGLEAAADAVKSRAERPGALEYRLVDAGGRRLAGDLVFNAPAIGWSRVVNRGAEADGDHHGALVVQTVALPGGALLSVADDLSRSEAIRNAIFRSIAAWGAAAIGLGLAAGLWLTSRALRRMEAVVATVAAVGRGDLAARAPLSGTGDDIDGLAGGVNAMLDRIGTLVQALRRVSADLAHELRTPLTHVRQRLERASDAPDAATSRRELDAANAAMDKALRMFDAMLRLGEIDAGHARARFAEVDLHDIVERVADAYRPEIEATCRRLHVAAQAGLAVHGDADLLTRALANLVENSLKHGAGGGHVTITLARERGAVALDVCDDGPGIDAAVRARVTEPFYRLAPAGDVEGSGLGLAIVAAIARLHDATLEIGDANPGSRATILFPVA